MKTAIFLWVVIIGSAEDHWSRFPMPSMVACEQAIAKSKAILPVAPKQINSVLMFCAGEKEIRYDGGQGYGP